ncbi:MAG TPA: NDP-sugar synthase [Thermoplasmata archaeon]|nr:NDP-sugar synthase [Thermoplasmata archaeon]
MKALVLIGGFGTRLRPLTESVPKQLIPIAGKSMLYHVLDLLPPSVEEVVLATGYRADQVAAYVREHPAPWPIRTVAETEPLGTGGGMKNAGSGMSDPFFLLNSDVIAAADLSAMAARHRAHGRIGTMGLAEVEDTRPYGVAALGPDDRITHFVEKPEPKDAPSRWINAGLAVWARAVLDRIPSGRAVSFEREIVPGLLSEGLFGFRLSRYWDDAGTPDRLLRSQRLLFDDGRAANVRRPDGSLGAGPVSAWEDATARDATLGPYVTLGPGVTVAPGARVEDSVLMDGVRVGRDATVVSSILGPNARVPSGARVTGRVVGAGAEAGTA